MSQRISVSLARRSAEYEDLAETIQLQWVLRSTLVARKYFKALQIATSDDYMYRRDRFYNFPRGYYTEDRIVSELNRCIDLINGSYSGLIPLRAEVGMTQEHMNRLHTYFEKFRGVLLNPHPIYEKAQGDLREAFDQFNIMIHRYEDSGFSQRGMGVGVPKFYLTFGLNEKNQRYPLATEDFHEFTFEHNFGTLIVNYCEVGKPLQDVWRDGDEDIGSEAVIPLRYYSADSMALFAPRVGADLNAAFRSDFNQWWDRNEARLTELGFVKGDPRNAIGHLAVADLDFEHPLVKGKSEGEICELLSHYQWVSGVRCLSNKDSHGS